MTRSQPLAPALVWFRQDLRISDQAAVDAALSSGRPVLAAYVLDDDSPGEWAMGGASRWWLHASLTGLAHALEQHGAALVLRRGRFKDVIPSLARECGAAEVHAGRMHEPWARQADEAVQAALGATPLHLHRTGTLFDLDATRTKTGGIYGMYTPFARACRLRGEPHDPTPAPSHIAAGTPLPSDDLAGWGLLPTRPDWAAGFRDTWQPGEDPAKARLAGFVSDAVNGYATGRNLPGQQGTSRLSAALHWGELSPAQAWHAAAAIPGDGAVKFLGELLWREFAAYLLFHNPTLPNRPLRPRFEDLATRREPTELHAWQRGRTGIPIVDAGMRQLWHTGWMHNRVRMVAASFLVKQLLMDWREGERWFWDTLVDADLATNAASWQWVAGCGIDSQPFFRVFNPVSQGETWDAEGAYVRQWVPELAALPDRYLHAPWTAPAHMLDKAGIRLGHTYPTPIVDLVQARQRALDTYRSTVRRDAA